VLGAGRSDLIVFLLPLRNQYFSLGQSGEDFPVKEFIPQFAVELFYVAVLPGTAGFDKEGFHSNFS
jgi:hypothetical protein